MRFSYQKLSLEESARFCQKIYVNCLDERIIEADNFELENFRKIFKQTGHLQTLLYPYYLDMQRTEGNEHQEEAENKKFSIWNQKILKYFYFLLNEECRAYLIDLRFEWLGGRSINWYINLEICTKSLIFLLDLYWGLLWSRVNHVNPMRHKRRF
jgi:hypothetical protein